MCKHLSRRNYNIFYSTMGVIRNTFKVAPLEAQIIDKK